MKVDDPRVIAAMAHLDQRAEGGQCAEMVAEMLDAAFSIGGYTDTPLSATKVVMWSGEILTRIDVALADLTRLQRDVQLFQGAADKLRKR